MMRHSFVVAPDGTLEKIYRKVKAEEMAEQVLIDLGLTPPAG
jgi:peroxiredoxin Q/BCP